jgi:hypothetical protein
LPRERLGASTIGVSWLVSNFVATGFETSEAVETFLRGVGAGPAVEYQFL